jgi:Secretory lipase
MRSGAFPKSAAALVGGLLLVGVAAQVWADSPLPTGPGVGDQDLSAFYRWTEKLPTKAGIMLREEPMPSQPEIANAGMAKRILYTSTDARWHSGIIPVSGTFYLPKGEPPAGGWPLVSWAHGTLGVADSCAPSWTGHKPRDATYINRWLESGFAVVATDYQGLGGPGPHAYLIWEAEGRSVLDGIRAALGAYQGKLATKIFITGQSQGSGAALGATRIAPSYAPEAPLLATVATGVVSTFPAGPYKPPQPTSIGSPHYITLMMIGGALPDDSPSPDSLGTEMGKALLEAARVSCSPEMRAVAKRNGINAKNAFVEPIEKVEARLTPVTDMSPVHMPVPVLLGTGLSDSTLSPTRQYAAAVALCSAGSQLTLKTYPGVTHNGGVNVAFPDALSFFRAVMAGEAPQSNCRSIAEPGAPGAPAAGIPFND